MYPTLERGAISNCSAESFQEKIIPLQSTGTMRICYVRFNRAVVLDAARLLAERKADTAG